MIKTILRKATLFLVFIAANSFAQTSGSDVYSPLTFSNENYIYTRLFQKAMVNSTGVTSNSDIVESINYFDGLGRSMQNIAIKASPGKQDIVTHVGYDIVGRQDKDYLPYLATAGAIASFRIGADISTNNYYSTNYAIDINSAAPNPFGQKKFEDSPLNRVLKQAAPGKNWALGAGHEIKLEYQSNVSNEVKLFKTTTIWNSSLGIFEITLANASGTIFYGAGELYKTITKDENWTFGNENTTEEFKDKEGRVILKKTYGISVVSGNALSVAHETYYVYDVYGNLTYVLPPKADGAIDATVLNNLCYQYKYDARNRLVEKKLPGKEWEYIVYDKLDRPVLTQDANLKSQNKWMFTKYDTFSRPIYTGEYTNAVQITRAAVQALANGTVLFENRSVSAINVGDTSVNYSNTAFPTSGITPFTITYYDNYANINLDGGTAAVSYGITPVTNAKGLVTVSKVRILGTSLWTTNVNYYDAKGRSIYTYSKNNYLVSTNTVKSQLDFAGKVLETISTHQKNSGSVITITDTFVYDHAGRLLSQKQKINGQTQETIFANAYDNLGQLIKKGVGGAAANLQTVDYKYNIRGWLKNINDVNAIGTDLFAFQINYDDLNNESTPLYNGNISQTFWKTANVDTSLKGYTYGYDAMNRLIYGVGESDDQQEIASYDKNGNIMTMYRTGMKPKNTGTSKKVMQTLDDLTYTYDQGNKLIKVEDSADRYEGFINGANLPVEYTYDTNGNMKTDANKGITAITYNYLNLPTAITLPGGTISYAYDATGIKQRKTAGSITTDYANGFQYENNTLQFFPQPEGYVKNNNGVFEYIYQYKDHLGNVRLSYNKNLSIIEENNYYPFGLKQMDNNNMVNSSGNAAANKYKYQGQERQDELGLNWDSFKWRNYDPAIARFMSIDPLSEKYAYQSHYNFSENRVIDGRELEGLEVVLLKDSAHNKPIITAANNGSYADNAFTKTIHVFAHGNPSAFYNDNGKKGETTIDSGKSLGNALNSSDLWKNSESKDGFTIILHSCRTGRTTTDNNGNEVESVAEKISKEMKGVTIIAPDERDGFTAGGKEIGPQTTKNTDSNGNYLPGTPKSEQGKQTSTYGNWNSFQNGQRTDQQPGYTKPQGEKLRSLWDRIFN